jgi:hypothetical protein
MPPAALSIAQVRETLHHGMRLFHDGMRDFAMEPLATVLRNREGHPAWRLAAAGLLAESYRGKADFLSAEHYYRIGLAEADAIPPAERAVNEWYLHYRPRCALGVITTLRRLVSPDHTTIISELRATRELARHLPIADLSSQLNAVEGVYRRQCGDLDGAAGLLRDAYDGLVDLESFCHLYPEHVAALLLQVQLLTLSGRALVRRGARTLLDNPSTRSWSKAVAAACHLHLQFDRMVGRDATGAEFVEATQDHTADGAGKLLDILETSAHEEGDPLLGSEWLILRLAWYRAAGLTDTVSDTANKLLETMTRTPPILGVLRACETQLLVSQFPSATTRVDPAVSALVQRGSQALNDLRASIASYGYGADTVAAWAHLLETTDPSARITGWLDGPLASLRCLAWP